MIKTNVNSKYKKIILSIITVFFITITTGCSSNDSSENAINVDTYKGSNYNENTPTKPSCH